MPYKVHDVETETWRISWLAFSSACFVVEALGMTEIWDGRPEEEVLG